MASQQRRLSRFARSAAIATSAFALVALTACSGPANGGDTSELGFAAAEQDADSAITVWVDALCINQDDTDEKSEQIGQMPSIYCNASHVCVWLGVEEGSSTVSAMAMKFIPEVINPQKHDSLLNDNKMVPYWASLFELLEWSW